MTAEAWSTHQLGDIFTLGSGETKPEDTQPFPDDEKSVPVFGGNGISGFTKMSLISEPTIVIGRVGENCGCVHSVVPPAWITDNALYIRQWKGKHSVEFFAQLLDYLNLSKLRNKGGQPLVSQKPICGQQVTLPSYEGQVPIASILSTWDRGIRQLSDMVAAKIRFKQGQMQKQFAGNLRFPEFNDRWHSVRLSDVTEECSERNRGRMGLESVMAVTKADGIVPMRERTIGASIDRYLVVQKNCFAYNPMRINIGSIARWQGDKDILVSPDYVVFRCKEESKNFPGLDSDFLDHFRRSKLWEKFVMATGNGSVRIRIYYSELSRLKLNLPSLAEQTKIAKLLNAMDREIELLRKQLDLLKLQKKGLMQKLLTGQVRVKLPKGAK